MATKACSIVNKITNSLPDHVIELLGNLVREEADGAAAVNEFGQGIKFALPASESRDDEVSSSDDSEEEVRREVNLQYTGSNTAPADRAVGQKPLGSAEKQIDSTWLQEQVVKAYGNEGSSELGLSTEVLSSTIFDYLSSPKSDSELQNDVRVKCCFLSKSVMLFSALNFTN